MNHTFVICAYKESLFLEECIQSLLCQTIKSHILISTSTPNSYLDAVSQKYQIPIYVNDIAGGIAEDWNFGMNKAETPFVTIAHQDDIYEPQYAEKILNLIGESNNPLIAFTDYYEIRDGAKVYKNRLLQIKRLLLSPLSVKAAKGNKFIRRRSLSLGNGICCPSVTYVRSNLPNPLFLNTFKCNLDWQTWEQLSKLDGDFLYLNTRLVGHRIHVDSETTHLILDNQRKKEDLEMFCRFWPLGIAKFLTKFYVTAEKSNTLK